MKIFHNQTLIVATIFSCLVTPINIYAKEWVVAVNNIKETVKVETIDTYQAYPTNIQINKFKNNLEVEGVIKQKRHNNQRIRGHVDVDLISVDGEIIKSQLLPLKYFSVSRKHDHQRKFSAMFLLPDSSNYTVRVRHHINMNGHK